MLFNRFVVTALSLLGVGGLSCGSKYLHKALYPQGETWIPVSHEMEWYRESWEAALETPGLCVERMFPKAQEEGLLINRAKVTEVIAKDVPVTTVFEGDNFIKGKPALGCVVMNIKKFEYGRGYWRKAFRGEIALRTDKEGGIWMFGQSTGGGYNFKQLAFDKNKDGSWKIKNAIGGSAYADITNSPGSSAFWHLNIHKDIDKECLTRIGSKKVKNRQICKSSKLQEIKSINGTGIWMEGSGNQKFSSGVSNPWDLVFSGSAPKGVKPQNHYTKLTGGPNLAQIYDTETKTWAREERKQYFDQKIVWKGNDERRGLGIDLDELCSKTRRSGTRREFSDATTDMFCYETQKKVLKGNTNYDNV